MKKPPASALERQVANLIRRLHACKERNRHARLVRRKMSELILDFETSPEPRSYMGIYNELRALVEWMP